MQGKGLYLGEKAWVRGFRCSAVHLEASTHTCTHTHAHAHTHTYAHTHTHTHTHAHTNAHTHTHAHTHSHTHPHTHPALFEKAEVVTDERKPNHLIIAISSDRGLCGGIHSNVGKSIRATMAERAADSTTNIVCVGDKIRTIMQRYCRKNILLNFTNVGKKPPVFSEASFIAQQILSTGIEFESAEIVYNWFR